MRPVFADPKTDFVFKRIFGSEVHKPLLIEMLNALLELDQERSSSLGRISPPFQWTGRMAVQENAVKRRRGEPCRRRGPRLKAC